MVEQFSGLLTDLSEFLAFFVVSLVLVIVFVAVYTNVTRHSEIKLIKENSVAAALAFSGSMIGFALPLASAMISSSTILEMVVWGVIALIVQIVGLSPRAPADAAGIGAYREKRDRRRHLARRLVARCRHPECRQHDLVSKERDQ